MTSYKKQIDEESFVRIFEDKTHYPIEAMTTHDQGTLQYANRNLEMVRFVLEEGTLPALRHAVWDHDTDLKSIENVVLFCLEHKIYGKTLEAAIDLFTSKQAVMYRGREGSKTVLVGEARHILSHFYGEVYQVGRIDLVKKLNLYIVQQAISIGNLEISAHCYSVETRDSIGFSGKNPLPFKDSGFDNPAFLQLYKDGDWHRTRAYDELMTIKYFDETGIFAPETVQEPAEITEGVFVDVDGTLIVGHQLNQDVVGLILDYRKEGRAVTIFTGGDMYFQKNRLRSLHLDDFIGKFEVLPKIRFSGKKLEIVIDDFTPEQLKKIFGIFVEKHILP
ncbi:MAG: hypothetical protein QG620_848 [Patescibacteria group bacterium]|nr:hypothetical protein [Patescibacteria group bacterium]